MTTPNAAAAHFRSQAPLVPLAILGVSLAWAYWPTLQDLAFTWRTNPQYQHGFLVPLFAGFLLYARRDKLVVSDLRPSFWGAAVLALGLGLRLYGTYSFFISLDAISLLPCVAGIVLLVGGWAAWRWAWPAVLFLGFMIPLPYFAAVALSGPLQRLATVSSTYVMQTLGLPALAEGNVILLNEHRIGIIEACSGLRMLVVFVALSTAVVLVSPRHWIDRGLILVSAIPIALISNIIRVTTTGVMYDLGHSELASHFFHDVAGYLMMPMGLGLLWIELAVLSRLFVDVAAPAPPASTITTRRALTRQPATRTRRSSSGSRNPGRDKAQHEAPSEVVRDEAAVQS